MLAALVVVVLTACGGPTGSGDGFVAGGDFSYMARVADAETGGMRFGLITGTIASDGQIAGERRLVDVQGTRTHSETTEFTGRAHEDGTATFQGIGPDGGDVTATLENSRSVMTTDQEPGIAATSWQRASLPAFNNAIQDATRGG
jgi:hypothetical protein